MLICKCFFNIYPSDAVGCFCTLHPFYPEQYGRILFRVFFAVTVVKKNGTTGMVNIKTADDRKAK